MADGHRGRKVRKKSGYTPYPLDTHARRGKISNEEVSRMYEKYEWFYGEDNPWTEWLYKNIRLQVKLWGGNDTSA